MALEAAGLGIGAVSLTLDLFDACSKAYDAWKSMKSLDSQLELLRTKLCLQQDLLLQWKRDWYEEPGLSALSASRRALLKQHKKTIHRTLSAVKHMLDSLEPLRKAVSDAKSENLSKKDKISWVTTQLGESNKTLSEVEGLLASLYRLLPLRVPNPGASQMVFVMEGSISDFNSDMADFVIGRVETSPATLRAVGIRRLERSLIDDLDRRVAEFRTTLPSPSMQLESSRISMTKPDEQSAGTRGLGVLDKSLPVIVEWKKYDASWQGPKGIRLRVALTTWPAC